MTLKSILLGTAVAMAAAPAFSATQEEINALVKGLATEGYTYVHVRNSPFGVRLEAEGPNGSLERSYNSSGTLVNEAFEAANEDGDDEGDGEDDGEDDGFEAEVIKELTLRVASGDYEKDDLDKFVEVLKSEGFEKDEVSEIVGAIESGDVDQSDVDEFLEDLEGDDEGYDDDDERAEDEDDDEAYDDDEDEDYDDEDDDDESEDYDDGDDDDGEDDGDDDE